MNTLLYLGMALTGVVGLLCLMVYIRLGNFQSQGQLHREQLDRIEVNVHSINEMHAQVQKHLDQLAAHLLQRESQKASGDRHQLAIQDAKAGCDIGLLVKRHGLSSDEAALIFALHGMSAPEEVAEMEVESIDFESWDMGD